MENEKENEKENEEEFGFETPTTLDDAYAVLESVLKIDEEYEAFKECNFGDLVKYHWGLGRWIRNEFGLWEKKELFDNLKELGLLHPKDMSQVIIESYHAKINEADDTYDIDDEVIKYNEYWEENGGCDF